MPNPHVLVYDPDSGNHYPIELVLLSDGQYAFAMSTSTGSTASVLIQDGAGNTLGGNSTSPLIVEQGDLVNTADVVSIGDHTTVGNTMTVDSSGNGHVAAHTNANRAAAVLHRSAITTADRLNTPGTLTVSAAACTGASSPLVNGTTYYAAVSAANRYGVTGPGTLPAGVAVTTGNLAVSIALAQVPGVTSGDTTTGYDVFLGTVITAPTFVSRITEAQRASGCIIYANGSVQTTAINGSTPVAGSVIVQTVGTGVSCVSNPFLFNNAWTPDSIASIGAVNCASFARAHIKTVVSFANLSTLPGLTIVPFLKNGFDNFWDQVQAQTLGIGTALGQSFRQDFEVDVDGATGLVVCTVPSGTTPSINIMVELT